MTEYQMLKTISVVTYEAQVNFFEQEIYKESEFVDAFLDVQLLLKAGVCKLVVMDRNE
ncbi:hypothetical protein [Lysinibacillus sp. G4S2]|uniref:hypothetical protein n=1 Tax=Lysinibacillus sp. G4S2 TaxID=3055859 RepID=UPI0025A211F6|nr:hypothetical protein [Lysinibacillus sp. G4S2]MDM5250103.1 hypothetical protein [Lysinibacillus sp. G4S2]